MSYPAAVLSLFFVLQSLASPVAAEEARYRFVWEGAGDFRMTGAMSFDSSLIGQRMVYDDDMICFVIEGFDGNEPLGRWALSMLNEQTSWRLHFDPVAGAFVVEGEGIRMPQAWNMNGAGDNCGIGGFGFNLGNLGQDFCRDNRVIVESRVPPIQAFPAVRDDDLAMPSDACIGPDLLSLLSD